MFLQQFPYLLVYVAALILTVVVFYYAWKNRSDAGIKLFAYSILLEITWLIGYFMEVSSSSLGAKIFWDNFQYIGSLLAPVMLVGFALEFTEIRVNARRVPLFASILPLLLIIAIFSYQVPDLIRVDPQIQSGTPFNELTYGFGTLSSLGNNYLSIIAFAYLAILVVGLFRDISVTRTQLTIVFVGTLIPIVGSILGLTFGWKFANQRDISPLTFAVSNAVIALGIFQFRLFNVIPIARQALFETIDDGLIVLDAEDRVVDANPSAIKVFKWNPNKWRDTHIQTLSPDLYERISGLDDTHTELLWMEHYYDIKITPIYDRSGKPFGHLIAAHDITAQKNVEQNLQETNAQNLKRASQFRAIAQVSSSITSVKELQETLTQITATLSQQLGHYHVGIFLLDSTYQFAILQAANSDGGQQMIAQGYRLKVGGQGIVSAAISSGKPQLALDVENSRIFYNNPFLPQTRAEVAIPVRLDGELIGILDIQSLKENAFTVDDLEIFEVLASQVGVAIQNARLYEQNIRSLKEAEESYRKLSGNTWNTLLQQMDTRVYAYDGVTSRALAEAPSTARSTTLTVPVTIRGRVVGNLRLSPLDPNRAWSEDEVAIANAVADRAALALEGARLLEDAQKRASRESFLSDMASKLSTSFQLDSILRDTVEELGQTLTGSTVTFQLINPSAPPTEAKSNGQKRLE